MISMADVLELSRKNQSPAKKKEVAKPIPATKAILEGIKSPSARDHVYSMVTKDLRSTDIDALRMVSLFGQVDELHNQETLFLSMLEMNPVFRARDLQIQWRESRIG